MQIKAITIDQIKNWNLNINQLRNYLALEIERSEKLQSQLREAEVELSKVKAEMVAFHEVSIKNFKIMTQAENNFEKNALIIAIKNLRDQNLQLMAQIGKTKAQTKELKERFLRLKVQTHMPNMRELWKPLNPRQLTLEFHIVLMTCLKWMIS